MYIGAIYFSTFIGYLWFPKPHAIVGKNKGKDVEESANAEVFSKTTPLLGTVQDSCKRS